MTSRLRTCDVNVYLLPEEKYHIPIGPGEAVLSYKGQRLWLTKSSRITILDHVQTCIVAIFNARQRQCCLNPTLPASDLDIQGSLWPCFGTANMHCPPCSHIFSEQSSCDQVNLFVSSS